MTNNDKTKSISVGDMLITILDERDESVPYLVFVKFNIGNKYASFKGGCYNGNIHLEKFMYGNIDKYKFQCLDDNIDTLKARGSGRGGKPESIIVDMNDFISVCSSMSISL